MRNKLSEDEIIESLVEKYRDDEEVLEIILKAKKDLEYVRTRNSGQTTEQFIMSITGHLEMRF